MAGQVDKLRVAQLKRDRKGRRSHAFERLLVGVPDARAILLGRR